VVAIEKRLVLRKLGRLESTDRELLQETIRNVFGT
jgi:hypothetical protein